MFNSCYITGRDHDKVFWTKDGESFTDLNMTLPETMTDHCALIVDKNTVFIAGGYNTGEKAYLYEAGSGWARHTYTDGQVVKIT